MSQFLIDDSQTSGQWFKPYEMPNYYLPQQYKHLMDEYGSHALKMKDKFVRMKPSIQHELTFDNYLDKMHSLLYIEEIEYLMIMSKYNRANIALTSNGYYLAWNIENLLESNPRLMVGDTVYLQNPYDPNVVWKGCVRKIKYGHAYLQFPHVFHVNYKGEGYNIYVESSRTTKRRHHYALDLAIEFHGIDLLFPSTLKLKYPRECFNISGTKQNRNMKSVKEETNEDNENIQEVEENLNNSVLSDTETSDSDSDKTYQSSSETTTYYLNTMNIGWYNNHLNSHQKEAVLNVLQGRARPLPYVIFGPPGTGKTVTLVECILQILRWIPSSKILVTAPSNNAADRMASKLIDSKVLKPGCLVRFVAYGHRPKVTPELAPYCVTANMDRPLKERIIITTCSSAANLNLNEPKNHFSHIVVDEAGQASEPDILIPMAFLCHYTGQVILAGDPKQLGPVVLSYIAKEYGLQISYLERLLNRFPYSKDTQGFSQTNGYNPKLITKLLYNYRSVPTLLELTSSLFYDDDLISTISEDDERPRELLDKLKKVVGTNRSGKTHNIVFHGVNGEAQRVEDSPSWFNTSEIQQVFSYVQSLYKAGVKKDDIGIISPYAKQVKEIRKKMCLERLQVPKVGSTEAFQGQEFNVIILSTVRSTNTSTTADINSAPGFISDPKRLNVALSRAKVLLIIIGNPDLLVNNIYWSKIIDYVVENGTKLGYPEDYKK